MPHFQQSVFDKNSQTLDTKQMTPYLLLLAFIALFLGTLALPVAMLVKRLAYPAYVAIPLCVLGTFVLAVATAKWAESQLPKQFSEKDVIWIVIVEAIWAAGLVYLHSRVWMNPPQS